MDYETKDLKCFTLHSVKTNALKCLINITIKCKLGQTISVQIFEVEKTGRRVVGNGLDNITPLSMFQALLLPARCHRNCQRRNRLLYAKFKSESVKSITSISGK